MDDRRVQSTLDKLQSVCEDKVLRLEELRSQIKQRDEAIAKLHGVSDLHQSASKIQLRSAILQSEFASLQVKVDRAERGLNKMKEQYLCNVEEVDHLCAQLEFLMGSAADSQRRTQRHHDRVQDVHNAQKETVQMLREEYAQFDWLINTQQACDSLDDEMAFARYRARLDSVAQAKVDLENQIFLHTPRRA